MKKIITIVGARPQFIKTPLISQEIEKFAQEIIIHTGQHYDDNMSEIFFRELNIKKPKYNLNIGSGSQGEQTGRMLIEIEKILKKEKPDLVLVYGDTNSTMAGALAASKLQIPLAHIEAGLRSYNREMPEEINRLVTDHLSYLLFCPIKSAVNILKNEGINKGVYFSGDVMADMIKKIKNTKVEILKKIKIEPGQYLLATIHRQKNTVDKSNLKNIITALSRIKQKVIFPVHPRTKIALKNFGLEKMLISAPHVRLIEPVSYLEMIMLEQNAKMILTDSGGVQKEAYLAAVPCLVLRDETEWTETLDTGWNIIVGTNVQKIISLVNNFKTPKRHPDLFGKRDAHLKIAKVIKEYLK